MKRRRPSIFTAPWFRFLLGGGGVLIIALVLGPPVAGWLKPPAVRTIPAEPESGPPVPAAAAAEPEADAPALKVAASTPMPTPEAEPSGSPAVTNGVGPVPSRVAEAEPATVARPGPTAATVYRIQVGAFRDHRNADRLAERLRGEKLEVQVIDAGAEERRALYRVMASPRDGEGYPALLEDLRALGYTPETTAEGAAVTEPVPLHGAVEASRQLRAQGIPFRLVREPGSTALRVVRVGRYATAADAERGRAELAERGVAGIVVRER